MITASKTGPEFLTLFELIHAYEDLTGQIAGSVRYNDDGLWIEWIYTDGAWAGVFSCDRSLTQSVKKLHLYVYSAAIYPTPETASHDALLTKAS